MKLLGYGWQELLQGYFDHTVTFYKPTKKQDSTGQQIDDYEQVDGLSDIPCAVGNVRLARTSNTQSSYGAEESGIRILIANAHPEIEVGWKAIIDHMNDEPYLVEERTPNQSADVSEIPVSRWH